MDDDAKRLDELKRELAGADGWTREERLRAFHLELAADLEKSDPNRAMKHYSLAEDHQWTIGTFSTGGGEGLASMSEVYRIQGLRADVLERLLRFGDALEIWEGIQKDPNGLGAFTPAAAKIQHLTRGLGR